MAKKTLQLEDVPGYALIRGKGYIRVSYRDKNNKLHKKSRRVDTVEEAMRFAEEFKREYRERGPGAWEGETMAWEDLLAEYRKQDGKTPRWYFEPLDWFNGKRIRSITYGDCKKFRDHRETVPKRYTGVGDKEPEPRSIASINREMEILRKVLLFACQHGWLLRNPMRDGRPLIRTGDEEHRERIPTPDEEARLLAACVEPREHLKSLIIATRDTGLRRGALQSITWGHVNWEKRLLSVPRPQTRFKGRPKLIGMSTRLCDELRMLFWRETQLRDGRPPDLKEKVFSKARDFKKAYKTACKIAGIEGLRFNDLRHGFATDLMEAGVPTDLAMKAAGHKNREIHDRYVNVDERIALEIADALDQLHANRTAPPEEEPTIQ